MMNDIKFDIFFIMYRTHTCGELRLSHLHSSVQLSGWVHRKRDHGHLIFIDLRDHYGITQLVMNSQDFPSFPTAESLRHETVITVEGVVKQRTPETVNAKMTTGEIELYVTGLTIQSVAETLPLPVNSDQEFPEETRLTYRFLDLRREKLHSNIVLRSQVIQSLRNRMVAAGFQEFQTPILTASSPEGARDYLVPSRIHPGQFYALPQAPQQFKQLLMVAGFDRYFQIAPCFRDEDARADRSPGEFYQLDFEMSFVTQEDVFSVLEPILTGVFEEFSQGRTVTKDPYPRITYDEAMLSYGSDKPDLRNPIRISDVSTLFEKSDFAIFAKAVRLGQCVRAIPAPQAGKQSRKFFDTMNAWGQSIGLPGVGYIIFEEEGAKGPIAKFLSEEQLHTLQMQVGAQKGDAVFFVCDTPAKASKSAGQIRTKLGEDLGLIDANHFSFCWIVDFPMYERDEQTGCVQFSHNPFSMPQGGLEALKTQDPLTIKAYQYDIVCNGIELSSGAIRNHLPEVMYKAFEIAGYSKEDVEKRFGGMLNAFKYGAPPHGGCAPGIDRIVMMLANEPNIREVIAFPFNQQAQDLLMGAPACVEPERLKELHIKTLV